MVVPSHDRGAGPWRDRHLARMNRYTKSRWGCRTETRVSAAALGYRPLPRLRLRAQGVFRGTFVYLPDEPAD